MNKYTKYMELCYEEMLKSNNSSVHSPLVGALLLFDDDTYYKTHRDDSSPFKHAESILFNNLTKKINDKCILFITLEPCISFGSNSQIISCSELIVLYNIKTVYIGLIEPNCNIRKKGIKYLKQHNISINFFDKKIRKKIKNKNQNFIYFCKWLKTKKM